MKRPDGIRLKNVDPMYRVACHVMDKRYDAMNMITIDIPLDPIKAYLKDAKRRGHNLSHMGVILAAQAVMMALFAVLISYNLFGRDYGAAVMAAGNCGWGCGSGANAVANEKAVMDQYGWHNVAWVLYPSFAVIVDDIYNPIFLSLCGSFFAA